MSYKTCKLPAKIPTLAQIVSTYSLTWLIRDTTGYLNVVIISFKTGWKSLANGKFPHFSAQMDYVFMT